MHEPALSWGKGAELRARWAEYLTQGLYPADHAILADDTIVHVLFSQLEVGKKTRSNIHTLAHFSLTPIIYDADELRTIRKIFELHKPRLLAVDQTYDNLKDRVTRLFHFLCPLLKLPTELHPVAQWTLCAYTVLLAPWSAVKLRVTRMGPSDTKGFAIVAARDLKENEYIYELAGLMSIDTAELAQHTDLSVVTFPGHDTKHILFGPIRLVNHDCQPNAEFVHLSHTDDMHAMTIQTNRAICKGDQLFIDYGIEYWADEAQAAVECPCATCNPQQPARDNRSLPGARPDDRVPDSGARTGAKRLSVLDSGAQTEAKRARVSKLQATERPRTRKRRNSKPA
ncbi:hypothetical protein C8R47DRAFT_1228846 [Mycena vitilis]|nr:hypothetical protein C8R47DRAFT_1228846 [Mycena vitilis]